MDAPSVLVVVVVRDGAAWLRRVLSSLARQTHPRLGVLAVDNASRDGSAEILEEVLGARRVLKLEEDVGFPAAVGRAMDLPAAREADYLLLLHDDTVLDPDAVSRLVDAASRVEGVGVVGPKVLDWQEPRVLREVGFAADRLAYPHSPLEEGEIDQGQYDAPREVLAVSSAAMLVSRDAWQRAGPPDDRLRPCHADLEFCWRMRLAGYRVLVEPNAVAYHRLAGGRGERGDRTPRERYHLERTALTTLLTDRRIVTLLWVLPLFALQGVLRLALALLGRRFDVAGEMLAAWGWTLAHLPGTLRRRIRAQARRRVPDREITRFTSGTSTPVQRWVIQGSSLLTGRRTASVEPGEEPEDVPVARRVASVLVAHPAAIGLTIGVILTLAAFRGVLFADSIEGGAYPVMPEGPGAFFREFASSWRTTGLGGAASASPALLVLGVGSFLALGDPDLLGRLLVSFTPLLAGASCYAALRRLPLPGISAVTGAASYGLASLTLWSASEGRIPEAALLVATPWLGSRIVAAFGRRVESPVRWAVGLGIGLALAVAFAPSVWIVGILLAVPWLVAPRSGGSRARGVALVLGGVAAAAILVFPFVLTLVQSGGVVGIEPGRASFLDLLRLSPGPAPGSGPAALFLPVAALLSFAIADGPSRGPAWRFACLALVAVPLAWLAAAGWLPGPVAAAPAFLAAGAFAMAALVALATGTLFSEGQRAAFGARHVLVGVLGLLLAAGMALQSLSLLPGSWGVGEERIPPAWPVVAASDPQSPFRVLWIAGADGRAFPAPGGDPERQVGVAGTTVSYGITGRRGRSALGLGTPTSPDGLAVLDERVGSILGGRIRHGGAALAAFGVRYVVADPERLPDAVRTTLEEQVDLDLVQREGGLLLYRNARALPIASTVPGEGATAAAQRADDLAAASLDAASAEPLRRAPGGWAGETASGGAVIVAETFDGSWRAAGAEPFRAFGWAMGFEAAPGPVQIASGGRWAWRLQLVALAVVWAIALWVVRRRSTRGEPAARPARRVAATEPAPARTPVGSAR